MKQRINNTMLILCNIKSYWYWLRKRKGIQFKDFKRGCGFYVPSGVFRAKVNRHMEIHSQQNKVRIFYMFSYKMCLDPNDMVEHAYYDFIGYKGEKSIRDCTFNEYMNIYK